MNPEYTGRAWRVAPRIEALSRGSERIFFNPLNVNPAYFPMGGSQVLQILDKLKANEPFYCPQENLCPWDLFDFFVRHHLIVEDGREDGKAACCEACGPGRDLFRTELNVYLLLSQACNQACVYCLNGRETYHGPGDPMMSRETAFQAVETFASRLSPGGFLNLVFFGGEPLLNWPLAVELMEHCESTLKAKFPKINFHYHITTNLSILPDDFISRARDHAMTLLVDVDGPEDVHDALRPLRGGGGSFAFTARHIEKAAGAGINVALRTTVVSRNQEIMVETARVHKNLGGSSCAYVPLNAVDSDGSVFERAMRPDPRIYSRGLREVYHSQIWPVENLFPFSEFSRRLVPGYHNNLNCGTPRGCTPVISVNGKIFSCIYLVNNPAYETGDILKDDFPRLDVLEAMAKIIDVDARPQCRECAYRYLCGGGCPIGYIGTEGEALASREVRAYTHKIACATAKTCLEELFWSLGTEAGLWALMNPENSQTRSQPCL